MNAYEAAMKRLELEAAMSFALFDMWELAEEGDFEAAMHWQFVYLHARDEWLNSRESKAVSTLYWRMKTIASFGVDTNEF